MYLYKIKFKRLISFHRAQNFVKFELWDIIKYVMSISMYSYEYVYTQTSEFTILFSTIFSIVFHSKVFIHFEDVLRNSYIFE